MPTRRSVVAGLGAAATSTALAGCTDGLLGGSGDDGIEYTDWIPDVDADVLVLRASNPAALADVETLPESYQGQQMLGVEPAAVDRLVTFAGASEIAQGAITSAMEGSFEADDVRDEIESQAQSELEELDEYGGYQRYATQVGDFSVGLQDGRMVLSPSDRFEAVIDARAGDATRLVDEHEDAELLTDGIGPADRVDGTVRLDPEASAFTMQEDQMAIGQGTVVGEEESEGTHVVVYREEGDADEDGVRSQYESDENVSDLTSDRDGRVVTVGWRQPTDTL